MMKHGAVLASVTLAVSLAASEIYLRMLLYGNCSLISPIMWKGILSIFLVVVALWHTTSWYRDLG